MGKTGLGEMPEKVGERTHPAFSGKSSAEQMGRQMAEPSGTGATESSVKFVGEKPDFKVVQTEYDNRLGKTIFKDVGAMWRGTSKNGSDYYTLKIGKLRLLVFPNSKD